MRGRNLFLGVSGVCALLGSALASAQSTVRFSEIHYDNAGTDAGEAIEISGPAGLDVTGWQVLLYNGSNGAVYDTKTLSGAFPATCDTRGVLVINYPANGIQNGSPDAMALVDAAGAVIEYLSYEGPMAAVGGPANGLTSVDIGAFENGTGPLGESLARNSDGAWNTSAAATFGTCNDNGGTTPPAVVATVSVVPAAATLTVGGTLSPNATAFDASNQPVSATFSWSSSAPSIAVVSSSGVITALGEGDAVISATSANGVAGSMTVHVALVTTPPADLRISEIHYDNAGTDAGEAIEIEGPAGADPGEAEEAFDLDPVVDADQRGMP
jgi:uncharacterized protein YjdB